MKKIILAVMLLVGIESLVADDANIELTEYTIIDEAIEIVDFVLEFDEVNIKVASYVKHHFDIDGLEWNEGFKNSAKGIELIKYIDENNGVGLSYITFRNSFDVRTNAGGLVYKYTASELFKDFKPNVKLYALYQKGYYGSWDKPLPYSPNTDDKFFSPMVSVGGEWKGFTFDFVGTHNTLHAITFGYSFKI